MERFHATKDLSTILKDDKILYMLRSFSLSSHRPFLFNILACALPGKNLMPTEGLFDKVIRPSVKAAQNAKFVCVGGNLNHPYQKDLDKP